MTARPVPVVKLVLEYDGTRYVGWQVQPNGPSIQAEVERALETLHKAPRRVTAAGRTDAGVHALGQVVSFAEAEPLPVKAYVQGMNAILPADVAVRAASLEPDGFDARRSASGKRYRYRIENDPVRAPLSRRVGVAGLPAARRRGHARRRGPPAGPPRLRLLPGGRLRLRARGARGPPLRGDRRGGRPDRRGAGGHRLREAHGPQHRRHARATWGWASGRPSRSRPLLLTRDRALAGPTAPPQGLCLEEVFYGGRAAADLDSE